MWGLRLGFCAVQVGSFCAVNAGSVWTMCLLRSPCRRAAARRGRFQVFVVLCGKIE